MSLVLTRQSGQSFTVGDATITVKLTNGQIKVIIDAPKDILVLRSELIEPQNNTGYRGDSNTG